VSITTAAPGAGLAIGVGDGCGHQHREDCEDQADDGEASCDGGHASQSSVDERINRTWPAEPVLRGPFMFGSNRLTRGGRLVLVVCGLNPYARRRKKNPAPASQSGV
jgi:hypothetical protein